jgi:hypothetical protein
MEKDRLEDAQKIVEEMTKDKDLTEAEEMIHNNKITFSYNEKKYRVHLLDSSDREELDVLRRKKFNSMLQEKDDKGNYVYLSSKKLIKVLKERDDIDIEKSLEELKKISSEIFDLQKKLGESESQNEGETILKNYHDKIAELLIRQSIIETQNTLLLSFSLENVLEEYVYKIITYLSSETLEEGIWKKLFASIEEFEKYKDEQLIIELGKRAVIIQYLIK